MNSDGLAILVLIISVGLIIFGIYFIYKQLEYVLVSVNLFRQMVRNQDQTLNVLSEIKNELSNISLSPTSNSDTREVNSEPKLTPKNKTENENNQNDTDTINGYKNELSKLGFSLTGSEEEWVIKPEKGSLIMYAHSMEKLKSNVESIIKQHSQSKKEILHEEERLFD